MSDLMRPGSALNVPADGAYNIPPSAGHELDARIAWAATARAEAMAMAHNAPPLEYGQYVAWTIQGDFGYTESLSPKHMAATTDVTLCGHIIPPPIRRLAVVYKTLTLCGACAIKYARLEGGLGA